MVSLLKKLAPVALLLSLVCPAQVLAPANGGTGSSTFNYAADTGAANAYVVTLTPAPSGVYAITTGSVIRFKAANANTGASTLAVNGGTATAIKKNGNATALASGDITAGQIVTVVYDGTVWQMVAGSSSGGSSYAAGPGIGINSSVISATPIRLLQYAAGTWGSSGSCTATFTNTVQVGSAIVVDFYGTGSGNAAADTGSATYAPYNAQTWAGAALKELVAINVPGGASYTVTGTSSGGGCIIAIYEYANVAGVDASNSNNTAGAVTATQNFPSDFAHMMGAANSPTATINNTAGWSAIQTVTSSGANLTIRAWLDVLGATGSVSNTATFSGGGGQTYTAMLLLEPTFNALSQKWNPMTTVGDMIVAGSVLNGIGIPARAAAGTSGYVWTSNGPGVMPSWAPATGGGGGGGSLVFLESHTASSSTEIDFTSWYSSLYDEYEIDIVNLVTSATSTVGIQCSTNGGTSYDTGTNYLWTFVYTFSGGSGNAAGSSQTAMNFRDTTSPPQTSQAYRGRITMYDPGSTSLFKDFEGEIGVPFQAGSALKVHWQGRYNSTSAVNAFRLIPSAGNFVSGTVRVYGIAH